MRRALLALLMCSGLAPAAAQQTRTEWAPLERLAQRLVNGGWIPGLALIVVDRDRVLHQFATGVADVTTQRPVTVATPFYIASSTKSFTALGAALLEERGTWSLDDPIAKHLPGASWHPEVDPATITLEALLSHTSGLDNNGPVVIRSAYTGDIDRPDLLRVLAYHGPDSRGRTFRYGNVGYNLVSLAMDGLGMPWQDALRELILAPLGMDHTTARMSDVPMDSLAMPHGIGPDSLERYPMEKTDRTMHAAGGMVTTVADLARWIRVQLGGGMIDGQRVFPASVIHDTHRPRSRFELDFLEIDRVGYGLGWYTGLVAGDTLMHHFGGFAGYAAHVSFKPQAGTGVAVLVNGGMDVDAMELLAEMGYAIAAGDAAAVQRWHAAADSAIAGFAQARESVRADRARRAARPQGLPLPLDAYTGLYRSAELGDLRIGRWGDRLRVVLGEVRSDAEAYDASKHQIRFELTSGSGMVGTFDITGDRARALEISGIRFERVR